MERPDANESRSDRIIDLLTEHDQLTRREMCELMGIEPGGLSSNITRLLHHGEIVIRKRRTRKVSTLYGLPVVEKTGEEKTKDFLKKLARAPRYKASGHVLIDAKFADEARDLCG